MSKIVRLIAKDGKVKDVPFGAKIKFDPQFVGAKIEVIDTQKGERSVKIKTRIEGKDIIVSVVEDGAETEVILDGWADAGLESLPPSVEQQSVPSSPAMVVGEQDRSSSQGLADSSGQEGSSISGSTIAFSSLGLLVLGGLAAAAGGGSGGGSNDGGSGGSDTTPPPAPTSLDLASADDTGSSNSDNLTKQVSNLTITGQAEPNARVEIFDGATSLGTVIADGAGNFSLDVSLAAGAHSITAKATDAAGNVGSASSALSITVDTTAPSAPIGLDLAAADDTGASSSDNITNKTSNLTITGQADANARVELFDGVTSLGTVTADGAGNFSLDVALAAGAHSITAKATDAAGNVGVSSSAFSVTIDATAPAVLLQAANSASKTITLTYDGVLDASNPPAPSDFAVTTGGLANPVANVTIAGSVVTLTLANAFAPGAVTVTYTDPAGDAANAIQDLAGNDAISFSSGLVADGYIRGAQVYVDTNNNGVADPGSDYYAGLTDSNGNFFLAANAPSGTIIAIGGVNIDTGVPNTTPLKAPAGSSTINPLTTLVQAVIDANPGTNAASASASVATALGLDPVQDLTRYDPISSGDVAAQKAAAQVATLTALAQSDAGANAGANVISNLASQITSASSGGGQVNLADTDTITAALNGTGVSSQTAGAIATASNDIAAANDIGAISAAQASALDRIAPGAPLGITLTVGTDSGVLADAVTNNPAPSVRVAIDNSSVDGSAAVSGDKVIVRSGAIEVGSVILSSANVVDGYVDVALVQLSGGTQQLSAQLIDKAGNIGTASATYSLIIDLSAPDAAQINQIAGDNIINGTEQSAVIGGTSEANALISISIGGNVRTTTSDASGNWTYALQPSDITAMGQGDEVISVTVTDIAGNVSAAATRGLVVDTIASSVTAAISEVLDNVDPSTGPVSSGATTNDNTLTLNGTLSSGLAAGDKLAIFDGSTLLGFAAVTGSNWTFTTPGLANGARSFSAAVVDAAGNAGAVSTAFILTVNATVPTATVTITGATDDVAPSTGALSSGGMTNDAAPVINGTITGALATGDVIRIYENGVALGSAEVSGNSWSFQLPSLADSAHAFVAVVEGAGGNQGSFSATFGLNIDTNPPAAPVIRGVAGNDVINSSEQSAVISGTSEADASISISLGGNIRNVTADALGNWSYVLQASDLSAMGQGAETISVIATDAAGNVSSAAQRSILIDTDAPAAPTIAPIAGNDVVNAAEQAAVISGTAEAHASIAITLGGNVRTVAADASGAWSYTLQAGDITAVGQGPEAISVTATDAAGNSSTAVTRSIVVDTRAPNLPIIGTVAGDNIINTNEQSATISGTAEANAAIAISLGGAVRTATADGSGNWSYVLQANDLAGMGQGPETISVTALDAAGNTSGIATRSLNVDTILPTASVAMSDTSLTVGETALVTITFSEAVTGFSNADVTADNGSLSLFASSDGGKTWTATYTPSVDVEDLSNLIRLGSSYADLAGNVGPAASSPNFVIDTLPNRAPVVANAIVDQTSSEDTAWSYVVPAGTFSDVDGDTLTYSATLGDGTALPGWLTFTAATRTFSGTPPQNFAGNIDLKVTASDGSLSVSDTFRLTVSAVNDAPVVTATQTVTTSEDTSTQVTVSGSDVDGDTLTYVAGSASHGTVTGGAGGVFTYTPAANYTGSDSFTVTVSDGNGGTAQQVVTVNVGGVNDAPVVANAIVDQTSSEDTAWSYVVPENSFTDPDGDTLTYSATLGDGTALPGWLTFTAATRTFSGTPPLNFAGNIDLKVTASDGSLSVSDTFRLTVSAVNDAPVVANAIADQTSSEDTAWSYVVPAGTFSDVDGDTLTYSATLGDGTALPGWLTFTAATRTFSGTPPQNFAGNIDLKVTASDGSLSVSDTFRLTVSAVNDAPVVANAIVDQTSSEDTAWSYVVPAGTFSDVDGDTLTYSATLGDGTALPGWLTFTAATRTFSGTPPQNFAGNLDLKVTASDGSLSVSDTFRLTVSAVNDAPVVTATQTVTTSEDTSTQVTVSGSDVDGDTLTYVAGSASHGTVTGGAGGVFTYTPAANYTGSDSFTVTVSDGNGGTAQQVVTVTVSAVNDAPVVTATQTVTTSEDTAKQVTVSGSDVDGDTLTYVAGSASHGTVTGGAGGVFTYTPAANYTGSDSFTVTVSDGNGGTAQQVVTVNVGGVNDAPVVANAIVDQTSSEDTAWSYVVPENSFTDPDGDTLTYSATLGDGTALPGWLTFTAATRTFSGTPPQNFAGNIDLKVTASDGSLSVSDTFRLTVSAVNDAPVVANAIVDQTSSEDTAWSYVVPAGTFSDVDGDTLTYSATLGDGTALPGWLTFTAATRTFSGTPPQNFAGNLDLKVTASDGSLSVSDTFRLTVSAVNDAPVVTATQTVTTSEDTSTQVTVSGSDVDGDTLTYVAGSASHGTVTGGAGGVFTYTPAANYTGSDSFTVTVSDGNGGTAQQVVTVNVGGVNDAPVVANAIVDQTSSEDTTWTYVVPENSFTDPDGDTLTYSATLGDGAPLPDWLTFTAGTRTFSGTPPQNFAGNIDLKVTASDGSLSVSDTFRLTVSAVNDAPVVANAIADQTSSEDTAWSYVVPENSFTDPDGDTLTYSATLGDGTALPGWLTFTAATRTFSGTPPLNFAGNIDLKVTASDGSLSVSDTFTLSVEPTPVTVANSQTYQARAGVADVFVIDANQSIAATIVGFEEGDILRYLNNGENGLGGVDNPTFGDGLAVLFVGSSSISLTNLTSDYFGDEVSFEAVYGAQAITYVL